MIPFLDLKKINCDIKSQLIQAASDEIQSGYYIGGPSLSNFEEKWAEYCNSSFCVGVGNGLDALKLSLLALGIGEDDEVIVPGHTFIATWLAVSQCGATPVPVDIRLDTFNLDPDQILSSITSRTKAVIPVHLYGLPCDMDKINNIALAFNLYVIADSAQAHGALYKNSSIDNFSYASAWSFYPGKNLGCLGDGGAITTNDGDFASKLKSLGNYGSLKKYVHIDLGCNSRLDPIQAAFLACKLQYLNAHLRIRNSVAREYSKTLKTLNIPIQLIPPNCKHAYHLFVCLVNDRDKALNLLLQNRIQCLVHYPILPSKQKIYRNEYSQYFLPNAEYVSKHCLSLPIGPHLNSIQVAHICDTILRLNLLPPDPLS